MPEADGSWPLDVLMDKGWCMDLSVYPEVSDYVSRLNGIYRDAVTRDGKIYALLLCWVLLFSVPALTEDALLRSLFGWTAYFARIPADAADTPDTLEWDWTWGGFWRALFGYSA